MITMSPDYTAQLLARLKSMPQEIQTCDFASYELNGEVKTLKRRQDEVRWSIDFDVRSEQGESGKPKFSNEAAREAEITRRLSNDAGYKDLSGQIEDRERRLKESQTALWKLKDEFSALKIELKLITAYLVAFADEYAREMIGHAK